MTFTREEKDMIIIGLQMRRNLIQTDNCMLSAHDVERMGKATDDKIKVLSVEQMQLCVKTEELIGRILNAPIV